MFTAYVPSGPAAVKFPLLSLTWFAFMVIVYVPLSAALHAPPGGVIWYVAVTVCAVPVLGVTLTNVAGWLKPLGPVTVTLLPPSVEIFTGSSGSA